MLNRQFHQLDDKSQHIDIALILVIRELIDLGGLMLYVWGSGTKTVVAAQDIGVQRCEICENDQSYRAMLTYRYRHFWYLIRFVTSRKYAAYCNRCNNGHVIERAAIADKLASDPVPFMDRRGWMVGLGAIAALVGLVVVVGVQHDGEVAKMLAEPKVGDIYEAEILESILGFQQSPCLWPFANCRYCRWQGDLRDCT